MITNEDIYKALCTIQKVCNEAENCKACVLRTNIDECGVNFDAPTSWNLNTTDTWRAFD